MAASYRRRCAYAAVCLVITWQWPLALVLPAPRGVVSFDLDDTLWPTARVITGANQRLQQWLHDQLGAEPGDVQAEMTAIRKARAADYQARGVAAPAINYRHFRGLGIMAAAGGNGLGKEALQRLADEGMDVWEQARHDSAEELLDAEAIAALRELQDRGLRLCAITNGLGSTDCMPSLAPLFDFTHLAEGERKKPHPHPFEQAMARYPPGTPWVHVGDSLRDDMGGATLAGMRTVLVEPRSTRQSQGQPGGDWVQDRRANEKTKQVEAREVDRAAAEAARVDARVGCLSELAEAVERVLALQPVA